MDMRAKWPLHAKIIPLPTWVDGSIFYHSGQQHRLAKRGCPKRHDRDWNQYPILRRIHHAYLVYRIRKQGWTLPVQDERFSEK